MKIKRYFAPDMRRAIRMVRDEQGADAVILSNRKVNGGVEIVSAVDYDADLINHMALEGDSETTTTRSSSAQPMLSTQAALADRLSAATETALHRETVPEKATTRLTTETLTGNNWLAALKEQQPTGESSNSSSRPQFAVPSEFQRPQPKGQGESRTPSKPSHEATLTPITDRTRELSAEARQRLTGSYAAESLTASESAATEGLRLGEENPKSSRRSENKKPTIEWSQDPSIVEMKHELQTLREMMGNRIGDLVWGEKRQRHPLYVRFMQYLMQMGLSTELSNELADQITFDNQMGQNLKRAMGLLSSQLQVTHDDILTHGGRIALIGSTGVGKTTTIAKLAARYTLRHGANKVALITTDCYRIGAYKQLQTYGKILGISVHIANNSEELRQALELLESKELVLIDTAGISKNDDRLQEQLAMLEGCGTPIRNYAVLAANSQRSVQVGMIKSYQAITLDGVIITKADETESLGETLSVIVSQQLPVAYLCDGQMVPEDIHPARPNNLVNRAIASIKQAVDLPDEQSVALAFSSMAGEKVYG